MEPSIGMATAVMEELQKVLIFLFYSFVFEFVYLGFSVFMIFFS